MENLNEHDITKQMLRSIRVEGNIIEESKLITELEDVKATQPDESEDPNVEDVNTDSSDEEEELTSAELSAEQKSFRDTVSPRVEFSSFTVYPKKKNAIFSGKFSNLGGLEWQFTLEESDGLYISADNIQITADVLDTIKKLKGYYDNWADEWAEKISTEYNRNSSDE